MYFCRGVSSPGEHDGRHNYENVEISTPTADRTEPQDKPQTPCDKRVLLILIVVSVIIVLLVAVILAVVLATRKSGGEEVKGIVSIRFLLKK